VKKPVIVADQNIPAVQDCFSCLGEVRLVEGRRLTADDLADAQALLVRSVSRVDGQLLDNTAVDFVGTATSGLDHIDQDYLAGRRIGFAHAPGANANSVVEYVLAAIAAIGDTLERLMDDGRIGVIGYGAIGRALGARLSTLGIEFLVYDPWLPAKEIDGVASLEAVLACSVITLHPGLTLKQPWPSYHLLDASKFAGLNDNQLLINASRGEVVDSDALKARLAGSRPPTVVLDVWEGEPHVDADLLRSVELGTAHIAGYSMDGKLGGTSMLLRALAAHWQEDIPLTTRVAAPPSDLLVDSGLDIPGMIRSLLEQRYDIRRDDALLRQSMAAEDPPRAFDLLRRNYRERRELAGSAVKAQGLSQAQRELVAALGCELVE
jgi:erythronate-4-phosphate dehydrogenase